MRPMSALAQTRRFARAAAPRHLVLLASALFGSIACGGKDETRPMNDYKGVLGSCLAKEAYYLQGNTERVLSSCTEHAYEARATSDPSESLREDYVAACKARGFQWSAGACPPKGLACNRETEPLDGREVFATHHWRTVWYGEQGFALAASEHKRILCPD